MNDYSIRPATVADLDAIVRHRRQIFADMGLDIDHIGIDREFSRWLREKMGRVYYGWLAESPQGKVAAGGGLSVLPWPPGPFDLKGELAFVYNVYTEPPHRRGLARKIMETIHAWCRERGIRSVLLNASDEGRSLYEGMGYRVGTIPVMHLSLIE